MTLTLRRLQDELRAWVQHNFPAREPFYPLLGAMEELGELSHAHLKDLQAIRGTPEEHQAAKEDAVADIIIFLADYCTANGIDLQAAVEKTWAQVKLRDWQADKLGGQSTSQPVNQSTSQPVNRSPTDGPGQRTIRDDRRRAAVPQRAAAGPR
ncbi:MAG TPA: hypothetical protein PKG77_25785, partial [Phycisphaerae bacterium]|nr:hypothetical protein [Phycisphaerae bacterium]